MLHSTGREGRDGTESLALKYRFMKGARALLRKGCSLLSERLVFSRPLLSSAQLTGGVIEGLPRPLLEASAAYARVVLIFSADVPK